jgi:hypothetical protein
MEENLMPSAVRLPMLRTDEKNDLLTDAQLQANSALIEHDMRVLDELLRLRMDGNLQPAGELVTWSDTAAEVPYAQLVCDFAPDDFNRILLLITLEQQLNFGVFRNAFCRDNTTVYNVPHAAGGYIDLRHNSYKPDLQTVMYLCGGYSIFSVSRLLAQSLLTSRLLREQLVVLKNPGQHTSDLKLLPELAAEYQHHLLFGREVRPDFGDDFPAKKIATTFEFDKQIFLLPHARTEMFLLAEKIKSQQKLRARNEKLAQGIPVLFYGEPGTGKTLSAAAIGNLTGMPVFRIDLATIISKYVGETEKKLARVFDRAEGKNWILFFDEADVLFGNRTGVADAQDRYANLLTAYLLQRIEEFEGVCILSTNYKSNIDVAMQRRFTQVVRFTKPGHNERLKIWENGLASGFSYQPGLNLRTLAQFEFTGAQIAMILKNAVIRAVAQDSTYVQANDIKFFGSHEYSKNGITSVIQPWPGEQVQGFSPAVAMENPVQPNRFYDVRERYSISNVNLLV